MINIEEISRKIWGDCWRKPLSQYLNVEYRTVRRWLSGHASIPEGVLREIERLATVHSEFNYEFDQLPIKFKDVTLAFVNGCCRVQKMDGRFYDAYDFCIYSQGGHKEVRGVYLPEAADTALIIQAIIAHLRVLDAAGLLLPAKDDCDA